MTSDEISTIIALAWCDKTTWSEVKHQTGLDEDSVMKIMKSNLKPSSYKLWRQRVKKHKSKLTNYQY